MLLGEFDKYLVALFLQREGFAVGALHGVFYLMALQLKVVVIAEETLEPFDSVFCPLYVALANLVWHLTSDTGGAGNEPFVVFLQLLMVGTRAVVETVNPCMAHELDKVVITCLVLRQEDEVPSAAVDLTFFQAHTTACTVHFASEYRFEIQFGRSLGNSLLCFFQQLLFWLIVIFVIAVAVEAFQCASLDVVNEFLRVLHHPTMLAVDLVAIVEELLDAEHVAVIGHSHALHAVLYGLVNEFRDTRLSVEYRILGMYV